MGSKTGPHSGPYKSQHPNKSPEQMDAEAAQILRRWQRGEPVTAIAESMNLPSSTAYERLNKLISGINDLSRGAVRHVSYNRLEGDFYLLQRVIEDNDRQAEPMTVADLAKLIGVRVKLVEAMIKLMGASVPNTISDDDDDLSDEEIW